MARQTGLQLGGESDLAIQAYVQDLLDIGIRRKWLILSIVLLSVSIASVYAWFKPELYRSSTVILVEHQKIPENYVRSVVGGSVAERVSTITQQVLSRTSLQKVIEKFNLYPSIVEGQGYDQAIQTMRENVHLETKGNRGRLDAFTISYVHREPMVAMKVTAQLASQFIEENLKIREQFVEGATEFLEQELVASKKALDEKEKVLSEFKLKYLGELPGQLESNMRTLDRLQEEKASLQDSLNSSSLRLELLQKSMHEYESMAQVFTDLTPPQGMQIVDEAPRDPLRAELGKLQDQLAKLRFEYTDSYPDVIVLKSHIKKLEDQLAQQEAEAASQDGGDDPLEMTEKGAEGEEADDVLEPLAVVDPYLQEMRKTNDDLKAQISGYKRRLKRINIDMKKIEGQIDRTPTREQELLILERDYENMRDMYQRLHEKKLNSSISENLERKQKAERFRILDPANLPNKPEGPLRVVIVLGGLMVGCGVGFGLAFALEFWSPTFRRSEDAEVSLGFPILATIPSFQMAYGKSFKSLPHSMIEHGNGHLKRDTNAGYLGGVTTTNSSKTNGRTAKDGLPPSLGLVTKWRPSSIVAEQYRVAATRLSLMGNNGDGVVVLTTSAMKGEGKTTSVANLAYTLARDLDESTLIIDCDFKCPSLHEVYSIPYSPGLAEYFHGDEPLEACIHPVEGMPLWILPVGDIEQFAVPLSKLPQLSSVIGMLKPRFRHILLDAPPILPLADINVLAGLTEVLLIVVRSGITPKDVVLKAIDMLKPGAQSRILLTDAWTQGMPFYARQGYEVPYAIGER